jgi:hypothetical protein
MTFAIPTTQAATPTNGTNGHAPTIPMVSTLEDLLTAAAAAPDDLERRRSVFAHLADLDTFTAEAARGRVCAALGLKSGEFRALLRACQAKRRSKALHASTFAVQDGHFVELRPSGDEILSFPLTNFTAWVAEDVLLNDGESQERMLTLEGELDDGTTLPRVTIPADQFASMRWLLRAWGARAIVKAGPLSHEKVREAIQYASGMVPSAQSFSHLGWTTIDGEHVYLTAAGGIGPDGPTTARVELPLGLESYALAPSGDLAAAVRASLSFLDLAPLEVTAPILATVYLAPLLPFLPLGFTLWLYGSTGTRKTALCVEALRHFGPGFAWERLPAAWSDTENRLEERAYLTKDAMLLVDDYAPQGVGHDAQLYTTRASRFLRAVGNRQGRGRLNSDLSARRTFRPRGLVASTGELLPPGSESLLARLLVVELKPRDVNLEKLTGSQRGRGALYAGAMAGFVQWIAQRWDKLAEDLPRRFADGRTGALLDPAIKHGRTGEVFQACALALMMVTDFAVEVGALTRAEADYRCKNEWLPALAKTARAQCGFIALEKPSARFLGLLRTLLHMGKVRLEASQKAPEDPEGAEKALGGALGEPIGWRDAQYVYLISQAAYHAAVRFAREEDQRFTLSLDALKRLLEQEGLLIHDGKDAHLEPKRTDPFGKRMRVLQIPLASFLDDGGGDEGEDQPGENG